jgi:outer membrane receptor protein involved in Fe transport
MIAILISLVLSQSPASVTGVVVDASGAAVPGASVTLAMDGSKQTTRTLADGTWTAAVPSGADTVLVRVDIPGFAPVERTVRLPAGPLRFVLRPEGVAERVTVSGNASTPRLAIETSVTSIDESTIAGSPAQRLDDQLRMVPGFSLFRRTSSAVANPTTQGVTLRGLSASGASRTLVVADDVPLNDPFGGWVYWNRIPMAALQRVDVIRGASGDLHGNDALGGVIRLSTRTSRGAEVWLEAGSLDTARGSAYGAMSRGTWLAGAAVERASTDGFVVIAPEARGPIDIRADSQDTSAMGWGSGGEGSFQASLRAGYFNEERGNGTPAQLNGTLTRWAAANAHGFLGGGVWEARGDISVNNYRQTFSAVTDAARSAERLTALQWVGSRGIDAGATWIKQTSRAEGLVALTTREMRANLDEASISVAGVESVVTRTPALQRGEGVVLQGRIDLTPRAAFDAGVRAEHWRLSRTDTDAGHSLGFVEPRFGASFRLADDRTLRVSWLTGFRTPTMNELYRAFRVGSTNTLANAALKPETSWGPEAAFTVRRERWTGRAIVYATKLGQAIYNRTVSINGVNIVRQRANGDARTVGSELELEWRVGRALSFTTSWAINDARFTSGELDGKRVPQVPRASGSIGVRAAAGRISASANLRIIGAQFDDDVNSFRLDAGSIADGRVAWRWSRRMEVFAAIENAFDEEIDTGRTPIRTVGAPRMARAGLAVRF